MFRTKNKPTRLIDFSVMELSHGDVIRYIKYLMVKYGMHNIGYTIKSIHGQARAVLFCRNNNHRAIMYFKDRCSCIVEQECKNRDEMEKYLSRYKHNMSTYMDDKYYIEWFTIYDLQEKLDIPNNLGPDPIFGNNTWEQINAACESGMIPDTWKIKDEITVTLSEPYNIKVVLQIWDFNHYEKSDGSGKAGIVLGCKHIPFTDQMNISFINEGNWETSYMSKTIMEDIYNAMPSSLQNAVKTVNIGSDTGYNGESVTIQDKVFLPSGKEVGFTNIYYDIIQGTKFPIFSDNSSRIKKTNNGTGSANYWWLRSSHTGGSYGFYFVGIDGGWGSYSATNNYGVVFCFCI